MNKCTLVGRLTKDIDLRRTNSGKFVCQFTLAVNRRSQEDGADFINCVAWNKTAELLDKYVSKGNRLGVIGRISTRSYKDRDNKTIYVTEVVVEEIEFLESRNSNNTQNNQYTQQEQYNDDSDGIVIDNEDLPF